MAYQLPFQLNSLLVQRVIALHFSALADGLLHDDPVRPRWLELASEGLRDSTERLAAYRERWPCYQLEVDRLLQFQL